jgi:predicted nucleic acid-binding protein
MTLVLDADVLIGALDSFDDHHAEARRMLRRWRRAEIPRLVSVVNLAEVLVAPSADPALLRTAREAIGALGIAVHRPTEAIGVRAARMRRTHPVSLADSFCLATARHLGAQVVSFDQKVLRAAGGEEIAVVSS